ncbi:phospholipase C/P1 nuclease [Saitoella complicata NRRL Y-17804]|uniref:Uncharacterized protein n=1 Tax=Saitoella complicata (strain BCRC 22490 / CBS 7301 / JCM 7358 / NBRC 10748 / NRRL Y-17804) TaxID=698492 RepID=A0A0E9NQZ5_SAICN|nr:phospholipase C/P1 nuclease [Saitoella complicata NRRL Y-17804]ODQ49668.1 phospholipase C/P1 nuclease [Saitoella complicata NRRL Y-17804]GAO51845.1 hypothetical protein G7K_5936-t1 [Saitoella complicata NRRL Y-17804]
MNLLSLLLFVGIATAYGPTGHHLTASLASHFLTPTTQAYLLALARHAHTPGYPPDTVQSFLVRVAPWADYIKRTRGWAWSGRLHYVNVGTGVEGGDWPPQRCEFAYELPKNPGDGEDLIGGIYNMTTHLSEGAELWRLDNATGAGLDDVPLRFLVHFLGDLHNPLHLTGRARGGNDVWVKFEGHRMRLHGVWDGGVLNKRIRELEWARAEEEDVGGVVEVDEGRGYVWERYERYLLHLIGTKFKDEIDEWLECPSPELERGATGSPIGPQRVLGMGDAGDKGVTACPEYWAKAISKLNCDVVWNHPSLNTTLSPFSSEADPPKVGLDDDDLSDGEYWDRIDTEMIPERLIIMGGVRLAAVLNAAVQGGVGERAVGGL